MVSSANATMQSFMVLQALEKAQVATFRFELSGFDAVDYLHDLAVAWRGDMAFLPLCAYCAVDGIHFGLLAMLDVLQHAGLEKSMLADGQRYDEEGNCFLDRIVPVEKFDNVLALNRLYSYAGGGAYVYALLDEPLYDAA